MNLELMVVFFASIGDFTFFMFRVSICLFGSKVMLNDNGWNVAVEPWLV